MIVTALRERQRARVQVDLDGAAWRVVPAEAVVRAGLVVGRPLDRETARTLARELRRARALSDAVRALRHRDLSRRRLDERLRRRGTPETARRDALETLARAGLVDDKRVAHARARSLADRGYGDAAIRWTLEEDGHAGGLVEQAVAALEPERARAAKLLGEVRDPRALRRLAAKGFDADSLADVSGFADGA